VSTNRYDRSCFVLTGVSLDDVPADLLSQSVIDPGLGIAE
jgi:hypothetical protein